MYKAWIVYVERFDMYVTTVTVIRVNENLKWKLIEATFVSSKVVVVPETKSASEQSCHCISSNFELGVDKKTVELVRSLQSNRSHVHCTKS